MYTCPVSKSSISGNIYVFQSKLTDAGRGVFAATDIKKDEVVEVCPVILIPEDDARRINESMLVNYIYYLGKNKNSAVIVLGCGSIYNHSYKPNAKYLWNDKNQTMIFIATREVKKGEEITVNYIQGRKKTKAPLWFERS